MKPLLFSVLTLYLALTACGPAAEDRKKMDENARIMSDTIKNYIEQSLNNVVKEVNSPNNVVVVPAVTNTANGSK